MDEPPRLSRFNVHQLRDIERALARHLRLDVEHIESEGFTIVPESGHLMRVTWRGSAPISIDDFQSIVDEATVEPANTGRQPRPGPGAAVPKVTRKVPRRRRGTDA